MTLSDTQSVSEIWILLRQLGMRQSRGNPTHSKIVRCFIREVRQVWRIGLSCAKLHRSRGAVSGCSQLRFWLKRRSYGEAAPLIHVYGHAGGARVAQKAMVSEC
jgi:hypothetical protein